MKKFNYWGIPWSPDVNPGQGMKIPACHTAWPNRQIKKNSNYKIDVTFRFSELSQKVIIKVKKA